MTNFLVLLYIERRKSERIKAVNIRVISFRLQRCIRTFYPTFITAVVRRREIVCK